MTARHRALEEEDIELIERVKQMPSLYDPRNANFRLAYRKEQDWEVVANVLGLSSGVDARRRWTVLRDRYSRELKQLRLHPEKSDFGKNDFFQLMDFLRRFVRKRRERRRNPMHKYDGSWEGSLDDVKIVARLNQSVEMEEQDDDECEEEEEEAVVAEEEHAFDDKPQHEQYLGKVEETDVTIEAEEYPEFVEVDATDAYEEYVEHQPAQAETSNSNSSSSGNSSTTKTIHNTQLMPIMLPQPSSSATGASYTITTTNMPALMQSQSPHQQPSSEQLYHQQQQQQQQQQLPQLHHQPQSQAQQHKTQFPAIAEAAIETEDDFFCKSIAAYLRQLTRRHKIKAKVEMFQILEKYIDLEESAAAVVASSAPP